MLLFDLENSSEEVLKTRLLAVVVFGAMLCVAPATAANIVVNPGFELGLSNWTVDNNGGWFIDTIPHSGNNDIATVCGGAICLDPVNGAFFYQDLSTVIGQSY